MPPQRILVVADDDDVGARIAEALRDVPSMLGRTTSAVSGQLLSFFKPDLVVVDLGTEGYAGDSAWRFRRALHQVFPNEPPCVAITRLDPIDTRDRADRIDAIKVFPARDLDWLAAYVSQDRPRHALVA